ncbi:MAG: hypothetical protein K1X81_08255 [Bacteroidia bacterium]|nr:hypothetical protein [Bacteroidia bacterium]
MKTPLTIILFLFLFVGIQCNLKPCSSSGTYYPYYSILDYRLGLNRIIDSAHTEPIDSPFQVKFDQLSLILSGSIFHHASGNFQPQLSFGTSSFACSPRESGDMGCLENIDSIVITSSAEFSPGILPGTPLNDRFNITYHQRNGHATLPLSDFTKTLPVEPTYLMSFLLTQKPDTDKMKFYIYIHLNNGISWTKETPLLTLTS